MSEAMTQIVSRRVLSDEEVAQIPQWEKERMQVEEVSRWYKKLRLALLGGKE